METSSCQVSTKLSPEYLLHPFPQYLEAETHTSIVMNIDSRALWLTTMPAQQAAYIMLSEESSGEIASNLQWPKLCPARISVQAPWTVLQAARKVSGECGSYRHYPLCEIRDGLPKKPIARGTLLSVLRRSPGRTLVSPSSD